MSNWRLLHQTVAIRRANTSIAYRQFFRRFGNAPLKVVYVIEREPVIVTVYPLRKSYRR